VLGIGCGVSNQRTDHIEYWHEGSELLTTPVANGNLSYWPLNLPSNPNDVIVPTAINALKSGSFIYVSAYDASVTPNVGYVYGFAVGSSGVLTPLNGGVPFPAGTHPSGMASDASSSYLYVTDSANSNRPGLLSGGVGPADSTGGQPIPGGWSTIIGSCGSDIPLCVRGERAGLVDHRILDKQRSADEHWNDVDGAAAGGDWN
jgi:hypothetical protein